MKVSNIFPIAEAIVERDNRRMTLAIDILRLDKRLRVLELNDYQASKQSTDKADTIRDIRRRAQEVTIDGEPRKMAGIRRGTLEKLARVLECDERYLIHRQDKPRETLADPEPATAANQPSLVLSEDEMSLVAFFRANPSSQPQMLATIRALAFSSNAA